MTAEHFIMRAKLAEQAERYDDMVEYMKQFVTLEKSKPENDNKVLTVEERNLLSVAYKNKIGSKRSAWRILQAKEIEAENAENSERKAFIQQYKKTIEDEMTAIQAEVLNLIDEHLLKNDPEIEPQVFYLKMKGDYCRYKAEFCRADERTKAIEDAKMAYEEAGKKAAPSLDDTSITGLPPTSPIRLGLFLNFSVFYYEIMEDRDMACQLAKTAFDLAIANLDSLPEDSYKDSTLIMQLIRDNLTLWTSGDDDSKDDDQR